MENCISISMLNDFIFCPVSIYFHKLYDGVDTIMYQGESQINGTKSHQSIDKDEYTGANTITGISVFSNTYGLMGKIDMYNTKTKTLTERKKQVKTIYDGYVFQLYAQYFAMTDMGYVVKALQIHSMDDNKTYKIDLPQNNALMFQKFNELIDKIQEFEIENFQQKNLAKCEKCIYAPYCDKGKTDVVSR